MAPIVIIIIIIIIIIIFSAWPTTNRTGQAYRVIKIEVKIIKLGGIKISIKTV